jgi:hypothetical protein
MFTAALFTIAKLWKQPGALQLINGVRKYDIHIYTYICISGVLFSHRMKPYGLKWVQLEDSKLNEVRVYG